MKKVLNNSFFQKQAYYKEKPKRANRKQISTVNNSLIFSMLSIFISGLLGGVAFSIGATAYLSISNKDLSEDYAKKDCLSRYNP